MSNPIKINVGIVGGEPIKIGIRTPGNTQQIDVSAPVIQKGALYDGPYAVTPSQETQTLETKGLSMGADVTVNPIPSNYGLITYNGSILTVS